MKFSEIIDKYYNSEHYERKSGRYWATDIYKIEKGYLTPKNFFEPQKIDKNGAGMIAVGEAMEVKLKDMFEYAGIELEYQTKRVIKIDDDIELVVVPDFIIRGEKIIEVKTPFSPIRKGTIPEKWLYQLEAEYRAFYLPVYLGVIEIPFNLKLTEFIPSKRRWNKIIKVVKNFHQELQKEVWKKKFGKK